MTEPSTKRVGDYEVLAVLGAGGMGRVYKVRNVISERVEAMKILLPDLAGKKDLADRFLREIKVLATLNHPNICALRTALTLNNQLVMVMEYVEGTTLAACLEQGPISSADALNYIDQVLDALAYAHQQNVIHRDIKPANMMLTPQGVVKLMDFGIARAGTDRGLTTTGTTLGSLYYMSPEQVKGAPTDARSDLYSVGVSLYEMVTGKHPFEADSDFSILAAHLQQPPTPPSELRADLPEGLSDIILMALAKDPAQRFQSAAALRAALRSVEVARVASASAVQAAAATQIMPPAAGGAFEHTAPVTDFSTPAAFSNEFPASNDVGTPPPTQAAPSVLEMSAKAGGSRGLYMTLGALIVLAVLVVAGLYVPRKLRTNAGAKSDTSSSQGSSTTSSGTPSTNDNGAGYSSPTYTNATTGVGSNDTQSSSTPSASSSPSESTNPPSASPESSSGGNSSASAAMDRKASSTSSSGDSGDSALETVPAQLLKKPVQAGNRQKLTSAGPSHQESASGDGSQSPVSTTAATENSLSHAADAQQLEELDQEMVHLASRAGSVNDSLNQMRQQQASQGVGLRADIAASQQRLAMYTARAQAAIQNQDAKSARKYLDLAEPEVERLEKFLGR